MRNTITKISAISFLMITTSLLATSVQAKAIKDTMGLDRTGNKINKSEDRRDLGANSPRVVLNGYLQFLSGFYDDNFDNSTDRGFSMGSEIAVSASQRDNRGITYGASVQLKASTDDTTMADEVKMWAQTKYGMIMLGNDDGPSDQFAFYSPRVGFGQAVVSGFGQAVESNYTFFVDPASRSQIGAKALDSSDANKVAIYTPRISGLRAGVSYAPEFREGELITRSTISALTTDTGPSGNSAARNRQFIDYVQPNIDGARNLADNNASRGSPTSFFSKSYEDIVELGANYYKEFEGIAVGVSGGYVTADQKTVNNVLDERYDFQAWSVGTQIALSSKLRIGGSYVDNGKSGQLKSKVTQDRQAWNAGIAYHEGNWGVGVNYLREYLGGDSGSGNYKALGFGSEYQLAPGFMVGADLVFFRREFGVDPTNTSRRVVTGGLKSNSTVDEGHVFLLGSRLIF